jgi:Transposase DDE domain
MRTSPLPAWSSFSSLSPAQTTGSFTIWVSPQAVENWMSDELTGELGASPTFTDLAIETMATVQAIYGLAWRQTQDFLQSVFDRMTHP